jgi:hypothetical protein
LKQKKENSVETRNAVIVRAGIGIEDPGMLSAYIVLDLGDAEQIFCCGVYAPKTGINDKNYAGHFIYRVLEIAGTDTWEQLTGKAIRITGDAARIEAIGHVIKNLWFNPGNEFVQSDKEVSS